MDPLQLPGGDLVSKGVADLARGEETLEALLVSIGSERLRTAGLRVDAPIRDPEHRLYQLLAQVDQDSAHSRYNALLRRLTSFESALECVKQRTPIACGASLWRLVGLPIERPPSTRTG